MANKKNRNKPVFRRCARCDERFLTTRPNRQKYCPNGCYQKAQNEAKRRELQELREYRRTVKRRVPAGHGRRRARRREIGQACMAEVDKLMELGTFETESEAILWALKLGVSEVAWVGSYE